MVAKVMHGYLLFGRVLASRVVPADERHPEVPAHHSLARHDLQLFKGANKKFKLKPWRKIAREKFNSATVSWVVLRVANRMLG